MRSADRVSTHYRALFGIVLGLFVIGCEDHNTNQINGPNPLGPSTPTPPRVDLIEFRVTGQLPFPVQVRVNNSLDGLIQTTAVLPYAHSLTVTGRDNIFVSLDAQGTGVGFLHAAIFINGFLFREGSSDRNNPSVSINGTYRRAAFGGVLE